MDPEQTGPNQINLTDRLQAEIAAIEHRLAAWPRGSLWDQTRHNLLMERDLAEIALHLAQRNESAWAPSLLSEAMTSGHRMIGVPIAVEAGDLMALVSGFAEALCRTGGDAAADVYEHLQHHADAAPEPAVGYLTAVMPDRLLGYLTPDGEVVVNAQLDVADARRARRHLSKIRLANRWPSLALLPLLYAGLRGLLRGLRHATPAIHSLAVTGAVAATTFAAVPDAQPATPGPKPATQITQDADDAQYPPVRPHPARTPAPSRPRQAAPAVPGSPQDPASSSSPPSPSPKATQSSAAPLVSLLPAIPAPAAPAPAVSSPAIEAAPSAAPPSGPSLRQVIAGLSTKLSTGHF